MDGDDNKYSRTSRYQIDIASELNDRIRRHQESIMDEKPLLPNILVELAYLIEIVPRPIIIAIMN